MKIILTTFGWKRRQRPKDQDYYIDAWLLPNPYTNHQAETGLDEPVKQWFYKRPKVAEQINEWFEVIKKRQATKVAIGCVGGRHRSVHTAEEIAKKLRDLGHEVVVDHLELKSNQN